MSPLNHDDGGTARNGGFLHLPVRPGRFDTTCRALQTGRMSLLRFLGFGGGRENLDPSAESVRRIAEALDRLDPARAKYVACYAYLLGRVAHADQHISPEESRAMERLVVERGGLPEEQAVMVVQMAKTQNRLFGGTDDFLVTREFNDLATHDQKVSLLYCLFAVSSSHQGIATVEDNEIRRISRELRVPHEDFIAVRSAYRQHLQVLRGVEEDGPADTAGGEDEAGS
jgi:uncharacterized tellurite resistance protein B-like protein